MLSGIEDNPLAAWRLESASNLHAMGNPVLAASFSAAACFPTRALPFQRITCCMLAVSMLLSSFLLGSPTS
jgi:hypothetical protein